MTMPSPCPCRGCTKAYEAGLTDQKWAEHAYEQGREHGYAHGYDEGRTVGYREGYNDHARSRAYAEQVYGPYPKGEPGIVDSGDGTVELRGIRKI